MRFDRMEVATPMGLALVAVLAGSAPAAAQSRAEGVQKLRMAFTVDYVATKGKSRLRHTYTGECDLLGGHPPAKYGLDGPGKAQAASDDARHAQAVDSARPAMAGIQEEMKRCGKDTACLAGVAQKMQATGAMAQVAGSARSAVAIGQEANFRVWTPMACRALSLTVDDLITERSEDSGEGGTRIVESTRTVQGTQALPPGFGQLKMPGVQQDLKTGLTEYRYGRPALQRFPAKYLSARPGEPATGTELVEPVPAAVPYPALPGPPRSGKVALTVPGGTVTAEWTITR